LLARVCAPALTDERELTAARAWQCFVESSISAGVKLGSRRLNLGLRTYKALGHAYGGSGWVPDYRLDAVCAARRPVPLSPESVAELLHSGAKKFTNAADVEVVAELYRDFFGSVASTVPRLDFSGLQWTDEEAAGLGRLLPRYSALTSVDLSENCVGAAGAAAIASVLRSSTSVTQVLAVGSSWHGVVLPPIRWIP
jgi:hypothetical protein